MLMDAFVLATLTTAGFLMVYKKLPRRVRRFLEKHALFTDFCSLLLTYMFLGGTLTALAAGAMVGIMTSMLLHVANNPNDFLYLYDLRDFLKEKSTQLKTALTEYGKLYRETKENAKPHLEVA